MSYELWVMSYELMVVTFGFYYRNAGSVNH